VVLIQLCVHRADLALPERIVERVVDRRGRDAETRRRYAVDRERDRAPAGLLIGCDILQLR
jgi:hypothetical protein